MTIHRHRTIGRSRRIVSMRRAAAVMAIGTVLWTVATGCASRKAPGQAPDTARDLGREATPTVAGPADEQTLPATGPSPSKRGPAEAVLSPLEQTVLQQINLARTRPTQFASHLYDELENFQGKLWKRPGRTPVLTDEGREAVEEALRFLEGQPPVPEVTWSSGLALGARDHVRDQGSRGSTGHQGNDRSTVGERVGRYGEWKRKVGETISYGASTAEDIVLSLIVDDGVADRGHRDAIFDPEFKRIGVAYGYHHTYGHMCVITFAAEYVEATEATPGSPEIPRGHPPIIER